MKIASFEEYEKMMNLNYFGTVKTVKATLPYMLENKCGQYLIVSSAFASLAILFLEVDFLANLFSLFVPNKYIYMFMYLTCFYMPYVIFYVFYTLKYMQFIFS